MVIKFCGQETPCTKAVKGSDWVQAYDGDNLVLEIKKLADMSLVELEGGDWTEPEPTQLDRIEAQTTYTAMMTDTLLEEV